MTPLAEFDSPWHAHYGAYSYETEGTVANSHRNRDDSVNLEWGRQLGYLLFVLGVPKWGELFLVLLFAFFAFFFFSQSGIRSDLQTTNASVGKLTERVANFEGKLDGLTTRLSREALIQAQVFSASGEPAKAAKSIRVASTMIRTASDWKVPVEPNYFTQITEQLNDSRLSSSPALQEDTFAARTALADYRSSLTTLPTLLVGHKEMSPLESIEVAHRLGYLSILSSPPGVEHFKLEGPLPDLRRTIQDFVNLAFVGGKQTLDRYAWRHVLFVNVQIIYNGGATELNDVTFVNCTFVVSRSPESVQLLDIAALGRKSGTLG